MTPTERRQLKWRLRQMNNKQALYRRLWIEIDMKKRELERFVGTESYI